MKKLFDQMIKFGIVGAICFVIDYVIGLIVMNLVMIVLSPAYFEIASVVGSVVGFTVSVIANYILSFKFVFARKENMDKKLEFVAFLVLSIIGLLLNSVLVWISVGPIYGGSAFFQERLGYNLVYTGTKIFATAVVMIYNFITRKIFLEQKENGVNRYK